MNGTDDNENGFWDEAVVISSYSRADAIEDGTLVDVSQVVPTGFRFPVAVTARVWAEVVVPTEEDSDRGQSIEGRLSDILWMLKHSAMRTEGSEIQFKVIVAVGGKQTTVFLWALVGPGDTSEPVITIMMPEED